MRPVTSAELDCCLQLPGNSRGVFVYCSMKYSEKFFKFPVKLYLTKDVEERDELETRLGVELKVEKEDLEYVVGWESVDVEDICGYGTIFSRNRTLEQVREEGFDCTLVYLKYGKEIGCSWSPKKFEEKLNQFYEKVQAERMKQAQENVAEIVSQLETKKPNFFQRLFGKNKS